MAKLIPVAPLAKLKRSKPICVEHRGVPYCVVKTKDGEIRSFVTVCTHDDLAMFPPDARKDKLICPFHEAAFDAATGKLAKSSPKKAKRLPKVGVEIIDGVIHIEAQKKHRKLLPKSERKWVEKEGGKLRKRLRKE
ncbi:MAG TPA: Rieske 2Fe-2S domain-containing protein [Blastocatellia bacterium]|nr:Rieske 2Fe-2S domain-containing protein [Blastocatellia bacterium]